MESVGLSVRCFGSAEEFHAFADHAAEFYAGSGNDSGRALELARANAANRPTRRAARLAQAMEIQASAPGAPKESIKGGARRP